MSCTSLNNKIPVLGFAAFSGTGKTTLLKQLIPLLKNAGLRIGMIKHAHHDFDIDHAGKDSYELRKAGAQQMLIASSQRWALMVETPDQAEADLDTLLNQLDHTQLDLILVEGFRHVPFTKIELHRDGMNVPYLYPQDTSIVALASDSNLPATDCPLPQLDLNNPAQIASFICKEILKRQTEC
jgi:molybdopterin-guanine dinucleotide biosynthesis protein MobB